MKVMWYNL